MGGGASKLRRKRVKGEIDQMNDRVLGGMFLRFIQNIHYIVSNRLYIDIFKQYTNNFHT